MIIFNYALSRSRCSIVYPSVMFILEHYIGIDRKDLHDVKKHADTHAPQADMVTEMYHGSIVRSRISGGRSIDNNDNNHNRFKSN